MGRLCEIECPALVVSGEDDMLTLPKYGDFIEKNLRRARRVRLVAAGHLAPIEKPAEVNRAIAEFLDEVCL